MENILGLNRNFLIWYESILICVCVYLQTECMNHNVMMYFSPDDVGSIQENMTSTYLSSGIKVIVFIFRKQQEKLN